MMTCNMKAVGTDLATDCTRRQKIGLYQVEVEPADRSSVNHVTKNE